LDESENHIGFAYMAKIEFHRSAEIEK